MKNGEKLEKKKNRRKMNKSEQTLIRIKKVSKGKKYLVHLHFCEAAAAVGVSS